MPHSFFHRLQEHLNSNGGLRFFFYSAEIFMGAIFLLALFRVRSKGTESQFKVRESDLPRDLKKNVTGLHGDSDLAQARLPRQEKPLLLEGIRLGGAPHEILGIPPDATAERIQQAYRELMKRYHPDRWASWNQGQQPNSQTLKDLQKIAEAINRAKEEMTQRRKGQK